MAGGRPKTAVTDEQRARARELLGRYLHKSRAAQLLMKQFGCGRRAAYAMIGAALEEFRNELSGRGDVDALTLAYAGLVGVAGGEDAKPRDRVAALTALVKLLGVKAVAGLADEADVERFLTDLMARRAAARPAAAEGAP